MGDQQMNGKNYMKFMIEMSQETVDEIDNLKEIYSFKNRAKVIEHGLRLMVYFESKRKEGFAIQLVKNEQE